MEEIQKEQKMEILWQIKLVLKLNLKKILK